MERLGLGVAPAVEEEEKEEELGLSRAVLISLH